MPITRRHAITLLAVSPLALLGATEGTAAAQVKHPEPLPTYVGRFASMAELDALGLDGIEPGSWALVEASTDRARPHGVIAQLSRGRWWPAWA